MGLNAGFMKAAMGMNGSSDANIFGIALGTCLDIVRQRRNQIRKIAAEPLGNSLSIRAFAGHRPPAKIFDVRSWEQVVDFATLKDRTTNLFHRQLRNALNFQRKLRFFQLDKLGESFPNDGGAIAGKIPVRLFFQAMQRNECDGILVTLSGWLRKYRFDSAI